MIIYAGAALLGRVAGHMIMTDAFTVRTFAPSAAQEYAVEVGGAIGVVIAGRMAQDSPRPASQPLKVIDIFPPPQKGAGE